MESSLYPIILQVVHQSGPCLQRRAEEIEHVVVVGSVVWQFREGVAFWQIASEGFVIDLPDTDEKRGFNPVTKSVFSTEKLESLGWKPKNHIFEGLEHAIHEIISRR